MRRLRSSEYGRTEVTVDDRSGLLSGLGVGGPETTGCGTVGNTIMWMSHTDYIETVPSGFKVTAHTPVCPVAAMENAAAGFYATQFHPEVMHSVEGFRDAAELCAQSLWLQRRLEDGQLRGNDHPRNPRKSRRRQSALRPVGRR